MRKCDIRTPEQALAYVADCTLATVCDMASKKSRSKHEYERQISIAQTAVTWMQEMNIDMSTTRAEDVVKCGSVKEWAKKFDVKEPNNVQ